MLANFLNCSLIISIDDENVVEIRRNRFIEFIASTYVNMKGNYFYTIRERKDDLNGVVRGDQLGTVYTVCIDLDLEGKFIFNLGRACSAGFAAKSKNCECCKSKFVHWFPPFDPSTIFLPLEMIFWASADTIPLRLLSAIPHTAPNESANNTEVDIIICVEPKSESPNQR